MVWVKSVGEMPRISGMFYVRYLRPCCVKETLHPFMKGKPNTAGNPPGSSPREKILCCNLVAEVTLIITMEQQRTFLLPVPSVSIFCLDSIITHWILATSSWWMLQHAVCCVVVFSCSVEFNSLWPHDLWSARLLCPWDSPGKNTGVGCHFPPPGHLPHPGIEPGSPVFPAL